MLPSYGVPTARLALESTILVTGFETPTDLMHNRMIADPEAFARERDAASWLFLCGEEFASMEGGMSYADVERAVPVSANVVPIRPTPTRPRSRPAADRGARRLPRPSARDVPDRASLRRFDLPLCRAARGGVGRRRAARAEADDAPFAGSEDIRTWLTEGPQQL